MIEANTDGLYITRTFLISDELADAGPMPCSHR
jgi:hypothetical protein